MQNTKETGDAGEEMAANFLLKKGYSIKEKKWVHNKLELDLVAEINNKIVFVEVKTRSTRAFGNPWEAVNSEKRKRIMRTANVYIKKFQIDKDPRFDIISIVTLNGKTDIDHIEGAFWPTA
ncbi:MAG: YraN family protein [Flavobacteriales bacterium]|jgi:putative endonuclease